MKAHLWQQFSSNHSTIASIVGLFETPEAARLAAGELEQLLQSIVDWQKSVEGASWRGYGSEPRPPEIAIGERYHFEWKAPLEWLPKLSHANNGITSVDKMVFLNSDEMWSGERTIELLMTRLPGNICALHIPEALYDDSIGVTISCLAPSEEVAQELLELGRQRAKQWFQSVCERLRCNIAYEPVAVFCQGQRVVLDDMHFAPLESELPAFLDDLRARGCSQIDYTFQQGLDIYELYA